MTPYTEKPSFSSNKSLIIELETGKAAGLMTGSLMIGPGVFAPIGPQEESPYKHRFHEQDQSLFVGHIINEINRLSIANAKPYNTSSDLTSTYHILIHFVDTFHNADKQEHTLNVELLIKQNNETKFKNNYSIKSYSHFTAIEKTMRLFRNTATTGKKLAAEKLGNKIILDIQKYLSEKHL